MVAEEEVLLRPLEFNSVDGPWCRLHPVVVVVVVMPVVLISLGLLGMNHSILVCVSSILCTVLLFIHVMSSRRVTGDAIIEMMVQIISMLKRAKEK